MSASRRRVDERDDARKRWLGRGKTSRDSACLLEASRQRATLHLNHELIENLRLLDFTSDTRKQTEILISLHDHVGLQTVRSFPAYVVFPTCN